MKTWTKRLGLALLVLAMLMAAGITASAASADTIWVGGAEMSDGAYLANDSSSVTTVKPSGGYAYYQDGVLTLHNYSLSYNGGYQYDSTGYYALIYAHKDLKIVLEGENTLKQTMYEGDGIYIRLDGEVSGSGTLTVSGYTYYGIATEVGNLTVNAANVTISGGTMALYSDQGNVTINGGYTDVSALQYAVYARIGSVYITDGELTAKSSTANGGSSCCAVKGAGGVSFANHLKVKAALNDDGQLGAYNASLQDSYDLIVVKNYPMLLGVKTTGGMVGESEEGGDVYFDSCESVFSKECSQMTYWTVSKLRTESSELNTTPVVGETYYFDITVNGENINFSGVSAANCDVKLDFYDVAFVKATHGDVHATITFSATGRLTHDVVFHFGDSPISGRTIEDGQLVTKPEDPGQEGMHFLGWFTDEGELYDFDAPVTKDVNLYAKFGHYVNFWYKGDEYPIFAQEIEDGQTAVKPADPYQEGKVFKGWHTVDGELYDFSTPVTHDIDLYIKFADLHTVTFYLGTSPTATQDIEDGKNATKPADPYQEGILFAGWHTEDGDLYDFSTPVTRDINLIAIFTEIVVGDVPLLDGYYLASGSNTPAATKPSGGYAFYDDGKLVLNNYAYTGFGIQFSGIYHAAIFSANTLDIELIGTNTLSLNQDEDHLPIGIVLRDDNSSLEIRGEGSLSITGGTAIETRNGSNITVHSGTIIAKCDGTGLKSDGTDLVINGGNITLVSNQASGILSGTVTVNGGMLDVTGGPCGQGIASQDGDITIKGGKVIVRCNAGDDSDDEYYALRVARTGKLVIADNMRVKAATEYDGVLGDFVEADYKIYDRVEITKHVDIGNLASATLPAETCEIEAEAFEGTGFEAIVVPAGCTNVGSRAFADSTNLKYLVIHASTITIASDALEGCGDVTIISSADSDAFDWAAAQSANWIELD